MSYSKEENNSFFSKAAFGSDFHWGVSNAAFQVEGAWKQDGKGLSIWDDFTHQKGKIFGGHHAEIACDFYNRFRSDLDLMASMSIPNFRFSISWSRIMPQGVGQVNSKGLDYYDRLVDESMKRGITPWVTLYHWDLPQALQEKGGWTNRNIIYWFEEYSQVVVKKLGDRVKNWMVLNEPMVFTGGGYFLGIHAPGQKGISAFIPAVHHATLCQGIGGKVVREFCTDANIGTTFSCSHIEPYANSERDHHAARKIDALLNRLFLEPALGRGYPFRDLKLLNRLEKYIQPGDDRLMKFDFDYIGLQNYTREKVKFSLFTPLLWANIVKAEKRNVLTNQMGWEVYPESVYHMLKQFSSYPEIKKILITESGTAFKDTLANGEVNDPERTAYLKRVLEQVLKAKRDGLPVEGYFIWTFTDNFEWAEGYLPRFGIVHNDHKTQERVVKSSGKWYADFLQG
ncbi:beta-glucosidase [Marivirga lumbricoides]|uniref:Beta-glucosidase n=1 Tax=Marivirga lumbricoides TaxID=1046115 RepID=A0ABQ1M961_9BACT|nr:beta-glucosidase [Marivirga lumbricoides]